MITQTMTIPEVAEAVERDLELSVPKVEELSRRFGSMVKKTRRYPLVWRTTMVSRNRTEYKFVYYAKKRNDWNDPRFVAFVPFYLKNGLHVAYLGTKRNHILIFTAHFIQRYKERVLKDAGLSTLAVVEDFALRNTNFVISEADGDLIRTLDRYNGICEGTPVAGVCDEGFCFGELFGRSTVLLRTIITEEMLGDGQVKAFEGLRHVLEIRKAMKRR